MTALRMQDLLLPVNITPVSELATRINDRVAMAEKHARKALEYALEIGVLLTEAKALIRRGGWNDWIADNCVLAPRTARSYMQLAKVYPSLCEPERQRVADLPVREAVRAIATDPARPARLRVPHDRQERDRVVTQFGRAADRLRAASRSFMYGVDLTGTKVAALRKTLTDAVAELDRLQQEPEQPE